ncbi:MAG: hypothetical protein GY719_12270 [bacterium]|nr:hypothetical protein [bacterium]
MKTRPYWPLIIGGLTLLLHAGIALFFPLPGTFRKYPLAAEQILAGQLPTERLVDFSPLYLWLSVTAERLLPAPEATLLWLQIVLAAAATGLLFTLLARRVAAPLAAVAALALAFDRHLLVYERILEPEIVLLFCLLVFLLFLEREHARGALIAGVFAALCLATRPTFLPAFLLVPFYFRLRGDRGKEWLQRSAAFAAPVAVALLLLALRAASITGDSRTPTMNPGTVMFEGNNALSAGTSAMYPPVVLGLVRQGGATSPDPAHQYYRDVARAAAGRELTIREVNAYWSQRAVAFARAEPGRFARQLGTKLVRSFHAFRWHDVQLAWRYDELLFFVPGVPFALLAALALAGTLFEARRWRHSLLFYAVGLSQLAVMVVFYVSVRQRLMFFPALLYFAAVAIEQLARRRWRAWPFWAAIVMVGAVLSLPDDPVRDTAYRRSTSRHTEGMLSEIRELSRREPLALHAERAVEAVATAPWWLEWMRPAYFPREQGTLEERLVSTLAAQDRRGVSAAFDLASVTLAAGRPEEARRLLEPLAADGRTVYRGAQQASDPLFLLARIAAKEGDRDGAVAMLRRSLENRPGDPFVLAELMVLTGDPAYQEPLLAYWSELDAQYLVGLALLHHDRPRDAVGALGFVTRRLPDFRDARVHLAAAFGDSDQLDAGAREYLAATRTRLEPIVATPRITRLFRRWAAAHPDNPEVHLYAAQVLHQHGYFTEALSMLEAIEPPGRMLEAVEKEKGRLRRALGR